MTDLAGMKIIVTGGAGSIGHATACVLAARGADILLVDINRDGLEQRAAVAAFGTQVEIFHADVSRSDAVQGYVAAACKAFGRIDGLFNECRRQRGRLARAGHDVVDRGRPCRRDRRARGDAAVDRACGANTPP
jgi:NADP-dependent 3-hydroxy acid dehydrogenase YdfG